MYVITSFKSKARIIIWYVEFQRVGTSRIGNKLIPLSSEISENFLRRCDDERDLIIRFRILSISLFNSFNAA